MTRLLASLLLVLFSAGAASARCAGEDLRGTLSPEDRAALASAVAATPYPEGNRWRATRGARVIDIVGTIHLSDPRLDPVMERLAPAVAAADLVLVEMSDEDEAALQSEIAADPGRLLLPGTETLPGFMDDATWQTLSDAIQARGLPPAMAARMQPWYLSLQLAIPPCAMPEIVAGARGLDHRVIEAARAGGVPVRSLEPVDTLFALFGQAPLEEQVKMLLLGMMPVEATEDAFTTTIEAYFDETHAEGWQMARVVARRTLDLPAEEIDAVFAEMETRLLDERNRAWIDVIEAAEGDRLLLAFGAAHLFGEAGVLALLEREGYTIARLPF